MEDLMVVKPERTFTLNPKNSLENRLQ